MNNNNYFLDKIVEIKKLTDTNCHTISGTLKKLGVSESQVKDFPAMVNSLAEGLMSFYESGKDPMTGLGMVIAVAVEVGILIGKELERASVEAGKGLNSCPEVGSRNGVPTEK